MAEGRGVGPGGRWRGAFRDSECVDPRHQEGGGGFGGLGGCGGGAALDAVPDVWGQADSGGAVSKHESLGGVYAAGSGCEIHLEQWIQFWGLAGVCDDAIGLSGSNDGQGLPADGIFCTVDGPAGENGAGAGEKGGRGELCGAGGPDQERVLAGVCDREWKDFAEYADSVRAGACV